MNLVKIKTYEIEYVGRRYNHISDVYKIKDLRDAYINIDYIVAIEKSNKDIDEEKELYNIILLNKSTSTLIDKDTLNDLVELIEIYTEVYKDKG